MMIDKRARLCAVIAAATIAAGVGCAGADTSTGSGSTTAQTPSSTIEPAATSPTPTPTSPLAPKPKAVDVTVVPQGATAVALGGPPLRFGVTLVNNGPDLPAVGLVVSLGHCSCGLPGASMMAKGSMRMLDLQADEWVDVPYVREGTGMDYITANVIPPFPLTRGQKAEYQFEMTLDAEQDGITNGKTAINATLTDPDDPMEGDRYGEGSLPISVET